MNTEIHVHQIYSIVAYPTVELQTEYDKPEKFSTRRIYCIDKDGNYVCIVLFSDSPERLTIR